MKMCPDPASKSPFGWGAVLAVASLAGNVAAAAPVPTASTAPSSPKTISVNGLVMTGMTSSPKTIAVDGLVMTGVSWEPKTVAVVGLVMTGVVFVPKTIAVDGLTMTGMPPAAAGTPRR